MKKFIHPIALLAVLWSLLQLYWAIFGMSHVYLVRPIHLSFALAIVFLSTPARPKGKTGFWDYLLAFAALALAGLYAAEWEFLNNRIRDVDPVPLRYLAAGILYLLLTLEASRRSLGWGITSVALAALAYNFLGHLIPGNLGHRFVDLTSFVEFQTLGVEGLLGVPLGVSAEVVFYFVLFSAVLEISGGGRLFIDIAVRLTGPYRGGPAKAAIVSSALMGTISGSATANVVGTGVFTIPLMKRLGFAPHYAGAVEAVASTGGQLMPPIMGAAAFILADMTGIPYLSVAAAAAIPAVIYYLALFFMVDFEARKRGLTGMRRNELPALRGILLERGLLLFPIILIVGYMVAGFTLMWSATSAALGVVVLSWARRATRMGPLKIIEALDSAARMAVPVAVPCAVAGIIVGVLTDTGLGLKFSGLIVDLATGRLLPALVLVMAACIILGMGMPTSAAYIMAATLMGPAFEKMGLPPIAGHLFIFYFAILSMVTPPVALASYVAAGIAESGLSETGWKAFQLSFAAFLVPFAFAYNPAMLLEGALAETLWVSATCALGVFALAAAFTGFLAVPATAWERAAFFLGAIGLIVPEKTTDLLGLGALVLACGTHVLRARRAATAGSPRPARPEAAPAEEPR
ncbi:MAG: TRAP transporter fused permease subunit [Candidatus Tectomicrobia bacterium]|nr:TRAP transporter fused permease subunit [Candidatus Tectomicrobia bacterium]